MVLTAARSRLGHALFEKVAGSQGLDSRARIHLTPGERWFEADSPIQRVHGDSSMFIGGLRALLLQSLHPLAMAGVAGHSGYRGDPWGRLARTATFLATTTFGPAEQAQQTIDVIRAVHERVRGKAPDGRAYRASDPYLLAWVHAAEIDSFLRAHQRYGRRALTPAEADTYVAQTSRIATALGVLEPPRTTAQLAVVLESYRGRWPPPRPPWMPPPSCCGNRPWTAARGRGTAWWPRAPSRCCRAGRRRSCGSAAR